MNSLNGISVDLRSLAAPNEHPKLSLGVAQSRAEAASVCLEAEGHDLLSDLELHDAGEPSRGCLHRLTCTDKERASFADPEEATEQGAEAIAWLTAEKKTGLPVVKRTYKGPGFDWYLADSLEAVGFQDAVRLEVSGIRNGSRSAIRRRVSQKTRQTTRSDDRGQIAVVCVVEFSRPCCVLVVRDPQNEASK